jgi:epoxyqueuosine reductase QueG
MTFDEMVNAVIPNPGNYLVGYADMADLLAPAYRPFRYAVVFGRKLDDEIAASIQSGPTPQYFANYHCLNRELTGVLDSLSEIFHREGMDNLPIHPTEPNGKLAQDYLQTLRYDFSHKMAATRAGIGWIGKTDLLVSRQFGPRLRLASILVDYPIPNPGTPITRNFCGQCDACVKACPAQAAVGLGWQVGMDRDEFYNPFKCREKCRELSLKNIGEQISLCGICVAACPVGKSNCA